ncbi:MAG: hypothetical protein NZ914_12810 [Gemmatales bacterium]|nr:hypothetical protein [Gemmatales bacterium]
MKRCVITQAMLDRVPRHRRSAWIAYCLKRAGFNPRRAYDVEYRPDLQLYIFVQTDSHPYKHTQRREPISLEKLRQWLLSQVGTDDPNLGRTVRFTSEGGIRSDPSPN